MVTVEGQYQNVRRFIRDVERSKQFVVINEVELQRASQNSAPVSVDEERPARCAASGSGTRGSLVSLQLNMATYFQRGSAVEQRGCNDQKLIKMQRVDLSKPGEKKKLISASRPRAWRARSALLGVDRFRQRHSHHHSATAAEPVAARRTNHAAPDMVPQCRRKS